MTRPLVGLSARTPLGGALSIAQSLNLYVFVGNTPTVLTDPTGACLAGVWCAPKTWPAHRARSTIVRKPPIFLESEVMRHDGSRPMTGIPNLRCGASGVGSNASSTPPRPMPALNSLKSKCPRRGSEGATFSRRFDSSNLTLGFGGRMFGSKLLSSPNANSVLSQSCFAASSLWSLLVSCPSQSSH